MKCLKNTLDPSLKEINIKLYGKKMGLINYAIMINNKYLQLYLQLKNYDLTGFFVFNKYPSLGKKTLYPTKPYLREREAFDDRIERWTFKDENDLKQKLLIIFKILKDQVIPLIENYKKGD